MTDNRTTELLRKLRKMLDGCRRTETVGFDTYWITADALDSSLDELEQAIADELNAELRSGTCENVGGSYGSHRFTCSECGESLELAEWAFVKFCHNCGKRVKR